jgi:hypothetical protein
MRAICGAMLAVALAGCSALGPRAVPVPEPEATAAPCPSGQEHLRTAQLFFGRNVGPTAMVSEAEFGKFIDEEVTPRFPNGLTVMDGGGPWRGAENQLIREASKVVLIVLPSRGAGDRIDAVRDAYKKRFSQESVLLVTQAACVSF